VGGRVLAKLAPIIWTPSRALRRTGSSSEIG
jgi:hypothetical protein